MADNFDERLRRLEADERSRWSSWRSRLVALVLLGGLGGLLYVVNRQDKKNIQENGVLLPTSLIHKASAARRDLGLLNRDLAELAKEVDKTLSKHPGEGNRKKGEHYEDRLHSLHKVGAALEPKLTREERRVLMATDHSEKLIEQFIRSSYGAAFYDHHLIETAEKQIARAQALARGEATDAILASADNPTAGGVVGEIKSIATGLQQIKRMKDAQPQLPSAVTYVPEIDGPRPEQHKQHRKHKRKHHEE
jgi:hypothetical protein